MTDLDVAFILNGGEFALRCPANELLIDTVRERCGLLGSKRSCDIEVCGACTVLVDGLAVSACTTLTVDVDGHVVETIEGLAADDRLNAIQQAFVDHAASQCGFCIPGMVMSVQSLAITNPDAGDDEIRDCVTSSICRCTGYRAILAAARQALDALADGSGQLR